VARDELVLVCPACQEAADWTDDLERCGRCRSVHLIRRLGQVECLDCGLVREPEATLVPVGAAEPGRARQEARVIGRDAALADEVARALDRLLGRD
jgi:hypothetical protein